MAIKTWFATSSLVSVHQEMSETDPGTEAYSSPATGWTVSTGSTNRSAFDSQTTQAASTFTSTTPPDGSIDTATGDCLRTTNPYSGSFASANWTVNFCVRASASATGQGGRMYCRLFRSTSITGLSATEITSAAQVGSATTNLLTTVTQNSSVSFNPGAFSVTNEYIFVQLAWERQVAASMTTADVIMRVGNSASLGTRVVSSDFTTAAVGSGTLGGAGSLTASPRLVMSSSATFGGSGSLSAVPAPQSLSATFGGAGSISASGTVISGAVPNPGRTGIDSIGRFAIGRQFGELLAKALNGTDAIGRQAIGRWRQPVVVSAASTATLNGTGGLLASAALVLQATSTFGGVGGLAANTVVIGAASSTFGGIGGLTASTVVIRAATSTFGGVGGLAANATVVIGAKQASATFAGIGSLSASTSVGMAASATFAGAGSLLASATAARMVSATFAGVGGLAATVASVMSVSATFGGVGGMIAVATVSGQATIWPGNATFVGVGNLTASIFVRAQATATFGGVGSLTAQAQLSLLASATFAGVGGLVASAVAVLQATATFAGVGSLASSASLRLSTLSTFAGTGGLNATVQLAIAANANFNGVGSLVGDASVVSGVVRFASATFAGIGSLLAFPSQQMVVSATFAGSGTFSEAVQRQATATFSGTGSLEASATVVKRVIFYDFPIGRDLRSDYGMRAAKSGRDRLVMGRRRWR